MTSQTDIAFSKQMTLRGMNGGDAALPPAATNATIEVITTPTDQQEMNNLKEVIVAWREIETDMSSLNAQIREKRKKQKAYEEVILRIMKKNNIGALDLKGSGGRLLYRRQTTKGTLNVKSLKDMLTDHMKSESAVEEAMKYINEHRGAKVRESILYEKECI
jgi:hypothetical protein